MDTANLLFSGGLLSKRKKKGKSISFSPAPIVHEIDCKSPSLRRLDLRKEKKPFEGLSEEQKQSKLRIELKERGLSGRTVASPLSKGKKDLVDEEALKTLSASWNDELRGELEKLGLRLFGSNEELCGMQELAHGLVRRAHLVQAGVEKMPAEMTVEELDSQLAEHKVFVQQGGKLVKVVALEEALLKDLDGLIGDGYDFGRRFISVEDYIYSTYVDYENDELKSELMQKGIAKPARSRSGMVRQLHKIVEDSLESDFRQAFRSELISEMQRRGLKDTIPPSIVDKVKRSLSNPTSQEGIDSTEALPRSKTPSKILHRSHADQPLQQESCSGIGPSIHVRKTGPASGPASKKRSRSSSPKGDFSAVAKRLKFDDLSEVDSSSSLSSSTRSSATCAVHEEGTAEGNESQHNCPDSPRTPRSVRASPSPSPLPSAPLQASESIDFESASIDVLFSVLFHSGLWREDYLHGKEKLADTSKCLIQ